MARRADGKVMKAETEAARQAFLYGTGDGKRIVNVKELAKRFKLHEQTVWRWMPTWEAEYEEILKNTSETAFQLVLSKETIAKYKDDCDHIRKDLDSLKWEMDELDHNIAKLYKLVQSIELHTEHGAEAISLFNAYLSGSMNKQRIRQQYVTLHKHWIEVSGVSAKMDALTTQDREVAKGLGKMRVEQLKREGGGQGLTAGPDRAKIGGGVFARKPAGGPVPAPGASE